jgi:DNA polymerase
MFTEPSLQVDDYLLSSKLEEIVAEKKELLGGLVQTLGCENEEEVRKNLSSNPKFAKILNSYGVDVPVKISKTTGKPTYALAKTDEGFIELTNHPNPVIQQLCAIRLGTKSTLEESRIQRFIDVGARNKGRIPVPLKYYGAHTGRWAGSDKINFQNLPSRDKKKKTLKNAILPGDGNVIINADSSQIEARVLAWLAGEEALVNMFARGEDVYCAFASNVFGRKITKDNPIERFIGKTCILGLGYGTGAHKLQLTLKNTPPHVDLDFDRCNTIVSFYRNINSNIVGLWDSGNRVVKDLLAWDGEGYPFGEHHCVHVDREGIVLPNGLKIRYPNIHKDKYDNYVYSSRRGEVNIWGGVIVENVVQALAKIIVGEQMLRINQRYKVVLTVHDAAVVIVKESEAEEAVEYIRTCMSTPPEWARMKDGGKVWLPMPITCEVKYGRSYGECG